MFPGQLYLCTLIFCSLSTTWCYHHQVSQLRFNDEFNVRLSVRTRVTPRNSILSWFFNMKWIILLIEHLKFFIFFWIYTILYALQCILLPRCSSLADSPKLEDLQSPWIKSFQLWELVKSFIGIGTFYRDSIKAFLSLFFCFVFLSRIYRSDCSVELVT